MNIYGHLEFLTTVETMAGDVPAFGFGSRESRLNKLGPTAMLPILEWSLGCYWSLGRKCH